MTPKEQTTIGRFMFLSFIGGTLVGAAVFGYVFFGSDFMMNHWRLVSFIGLGLWFVPFLILSHKLVKS